MQIVCSFQDHKHIQIQDMTPILINLPLWRVQESSIEVILK